MCYSNSIKIVRIVKQFNERKESSEKESVSHLETVKRLHPYLIFILYIKMDQKWIKKISKWITVKYFLKNLKYLEENMGKFCYYLGIKNVFQNMT